MSATSRPAVERFNPSDTTLWEIERDPRLRTTIVVVLELDRPIEVGRLRNDLDATTTLVPRLRQRVVTMPGGLGTPRWDDDPRFSIDDHRSNADRLARVIDALENASDDLTKRDALALADVEREIVAMAVELA